MNNDDKSNIDSLRRILELEHTEYKLNDQISAMKRKLEKKDFEISNLRTEVAKLKKELGKKDDQLKQMEQTTLSVGFLFNLLKLFYSLYLDLNFIPIVCTLIY